MYLHTVGVEKTLLQVQVFTVVKSSPSLWRKLREKCSQFTEEFSVVYKVEDIEYILVDFKQKQCMFGFYHFVHCLAFHSFNTVHLT